MIYFREGYLEYHFPAPLEPTDSALFLEISVEAGCEALDHQSESVSALNLILNGRSAGTIEIKAQANSRRGRLSPPGGDLIGCSTAI